MLLMQYDFGVKDILGKWNTVADYLTRHHAMKQLAYPVSNVLKRLLKSQSREIFPNPQIPSMKSRHIVG